MNQAEKQTFGKYYLQAFANGIKRFTQSKWMVAVVNGFIAVMPIIITASIFTLLGALPEMILTIIWQSEGPTAWKEHINYAMFSDYQGWASAISNWSMGIIGMLATAAIAKNLAVELNNKLPFERRMNETVIFFAAICVYLMLSVIEFTVGDNDAWKQVMPDHTGRAIFVDGMAAQGILPGIIIGLTLPYVFYISYKRNWTIRLPKQVPQTICQAFLAIIPLFLTFAIYGTIGYTFNMCLGQPILFALFEQIQKGLAGNQNLNDSYGLICIYTLMEGGFWFLGVHPEPVHAIMRATFWFDNIAANASENAGHIFIEPLMYGYGAMGGSGATLMLPALCLLCCRSSQMKVTGKTAVLPILFQVNEPALFGVPTILNPIFALPMIFTGMINDVLFKAFADGFANSFHAGSLYLPWSTPYFLQAALPTPTSWVPWVFNIIALAVCTLTYLPAVLIQDKQYLKDEKAKLGVNSIKFNPVSGFDILKRAIFVYDPAAKKALKLFKKEQKKQLNKKLENTQSENVKKQLTNKYNESVLKETKANFYLELKNLTKFYESLAKTKKDKLLAKKIANSEKVDQLIADKQQKTKNKRNKVFAKIEKWKENLKIYNAIILSAKIKGKEKHIPTKKLNQSFSIKHANNKIVIAKKKIAKYEAMLQKYSNDNVTIKKHIKNIEVKFQKESLSIEKDLIKSNNKVYKRFESKMKKFLAKCKKNGNGMGSFRVVPNLSKYKNLDVLMEKHNNKVQNAHKHWKEIIEADKKQLLLGVNPWAEKEETPEQAVAKVTPEQSKEVNTTKKEQKEVAKVSKGLDPNKKYQVLVLCLGAGSSAVLANTINKGLKQSKVTNIKAAALAWGQHESALASSDLVVLSPQLGSHANNLSKQAESIGFKLLACRGRDYIELSKNPAGAAEIVIKKLSGE